MATYDPDTFDRTEGLDMSNAKSAEDYVKEQKERFAERDDQQPKKAKAHIHHTDEGDQQS